MTWFGNELNKQSREPTRKNRFIVEMTNGGRLMSVSSVGKPTATVETKEYRMINHYYNYPGLVKWSPITIKFVDVGYWGSGGNSQEYKDSAVPVATKRSTAAVLWEMLVASGYTTPSGMGSVSNRAKSISSPEKAATMDISFGSSIKIHQLKPEGIKGTVLQSQETWELFNPIIKSISWGDLDYGDDGLVEYTLEISYDWAEFHPENNIDIESRPNTVGTNTKD